MRLLALYDELFLELCDLNRIGRNPKGSLTLDQAQERIESKLGAINAIHANVEASGTLKAQVKQLDLPICCFIDMMMMESKIARAAEWKHRLAKRLGEEAGDQKFFELLETTRKESDADPDARERLGVFYTCVGLGCVGEYARRTKLDLKALMDQMADRIPELRNLEADAKICTQAYEHTDQRNLITPPGHRLLWWSLGFVVATILSFLVYWHMFKSASSDLRDAIEEIKQKE